MTKLCVFAFLVAVAAKKNEIDCSLDVKVEANGVFATLKMDGKGAPATVPVWWAPTGEFFGESFKVIGPDSAPATYWGPHVKRAAYSRNGPKEHSHSFSARESKSFRFDLSAVYDMTAAGDYIVQYSRAPAADEEEELGELVSNKVVVTVTAPVRAPRALQASRTGTRTPSKTSTPSRSVTKSGTATRSTTTSNTATRSTTSTASGSRSFGAPQEFVCGSSTGPAVAGTTVRTNAAGTSYGNSVVCTIPVDAGVGQTVGLQVQSFSTEASFDFFTFYDGLDANAPVLYTQSGTALPAGGAVVSTTQRYGFIKFTSDSSVVSTGVVAVVSYTAPSASRTSSASATPSISEGSSPSASPAAVVNVAFVGCTAARVPIVQTAANNALGYARAARDYLNAMTATSTRFNSWFKDWAANWGTAKSHFTNIADAFGTKQVAIDCSTCTQAGTYAYVYPASPYTIYACPVFWTTGDLGTDSRAGTLVHEMSHFTIVAGTADNAYGQTAARALTAAKAINNADSHEYFAENTPFEARLLRGNSTI